MAVEVMTLEVLAQRLGFSRRALDRHRDGNALVFDDGSRIRLIILGRRIRIAEAELQRFLNEQA